MFSQAAVASGSGTHIGYFVRGRKVPFVARPKETPPFTGFASTFNEKTGHAAVESVIAFALTLRSLLTKIGGKIELVALSKERFTAGCLQEIANRC